MPNLVSNFVPIKRGFSHLLCHTWILATNSDTAMLGHRYAIYLQFFLAIVVCFGVKLSVSEKKPTHNYDYNRCYINRVELNRDNYNLR